MTNQTHAAVTAALTATYLSTRQVSEEYGIPESTLRYFRHCSTGPASFRMGRRVVYRRAEIEKWISAQEAASTRGGIAS